MRDIRLKTIAALLCLGFASVVPAQQSQPAATVPRLVRFSGSFRPSNGTPAQVVESVTLSVYRDQTGGAALWQETQNVAVDGEGKYSVLMGSTQNDGVPLDLLSAGEPRWLGVQFNRPGEPEQPRVLMASVPYALKSVDAETLGGKPASAYLLAPSGTGLASGGPSTGSAVSSSTTAPAASTIIGVNTSAVKPRTISGTQNFFPYFTDGSNDLGNSNMQQSGGYIGVGTVPGAGANTTPSLDLRTSPFSQIGMAQTTDYLTFFSSDTYGPAIYWNPGKDLRFGKGGTPLYNAFGFTEQMRIQSATGNVGIGTMAPASKLDVAGNINLSGNILYQGAPAVQFSSLNTAIGVDVLITNAGGFENTAVGGDAMSNNTTGTNNVAVGNEALLENRGGNRNTAIGYEALESNTSGSDNIAIGSGAGNSVSGGNSNNIEIGNPGVSGDIGTIRIGSGSQGKFFVAGVYDVGVSGSAVLINSNGQLGISLSSRRFKEDIEDMGAASMDLMRLRPVTYRYKKPYQDGSKPVDYGLIAEEVAEVYPDLVAHSADGQIETVQYHKLIPMLLNEAQKQNQRLERQEDQIRSLEARLAALEGLLSGKVSATAGR